MKKVLLMTVVIVVTFAIGYIAGQRQHTGAHAATAQAATGGAFVGTYFCGSDVRMLVRIKETEPCYPPSKYKWSASAYADRGTAVLLIGDPQ